MLLQEIRLKENSSMPFKKRHLGTEIALILSLGLLLSAISSTVQAQLVQVSCRANDAGDGWIMTDLVAVDIGGTHARFVIASVAEEDCTSIVRIQPTNIH